MTEPTNDLSAIMHSLGQMQGESRANHAALFEHLNLIRSDIKRVEDRSQAQVKELAEHVNAQHLTLDKRILILESDNKDQISTIAKHGAISGSISAILIAAAVELVKRL